jgi:hypothetical protein
MWKPQNPPKRGILGILPTTGRIKRKNESFEGVKKRQMLCRLEV